MLSTVPIQPDDLEGFFVVFVVFVLVVVVGGGVFVMLLPGTSRFRSASLAGAQQSVTSFW